MKCTLCVTLQCNLRCSYCYIGKRPAVMTAETAAKIVDFVFASARPGEEINIGFFGGEPLLEFGLVRGIVSLAASHPKFDAGRVGPLDLPVARLPGLPVPLSVACSSPRWRFARRDLAITWIPAA